MECILLRFSKLKNNCSIFYHVKEFLIHSIIGVKFYINFHLGVLHTAHRVLASKVINVLFLLFAPFRGNINNWKLKILKEKSASPNDSYSMNGFGVKTYTPKINTSYILFTTFLRIFTLVEELIILFFAFKVSNFTHVP